MDPYSKSKYESELLIKNICEESELEYVILRPPLVYGPGVGANFLQLLKTVHRGIPLPFRTVNNSRSIIYVKNLADLLLICVKDPAAVNKTYLVKDIDISTPDLVSIISEAFGKTPRLFPFPLTALRFLGNLFNKRSAIARLTESLVIDDSKIRNELGWKPLYKLEDSMKETVDWYIKTL